MHSSLYATSLPISQSDHFLLFQTLRGAVDIFRGDIRTALGSAGTDSSVLSEDEIKALKLRGYLTESRPEQELEQGHRILAILRRGLRPEVELKFHFPASGNGATKTASGEDIREAFRLAASLADDERILLVRPVISSPEVDPAIMASVLEESLEGHLPVLPEVTFAGLPALNAWLKSENFNHVDLVTDRSNVPDDSESAACRIVELFEHQIYVSWKCGVDGLSATQLDTISSITRSVRQKYPDMMLFLLSDELSGTAETGMVKAGEDSLSFISSENLDLLNTLLRFIVGANRVNFRPFFQPEADELALDLATGQFSYNCPSKRQRLEGFGQIHSAIEAERGLSSFVGSPASSVHADQCVSCKYALVCGRDWIGKYSYQGSGECASLLEKRISQVLPLLLFNLRSLRLNGKRNAQ